MIRRTPTLALLLAALLGLSTLPVSSARDDKPLDAHAIMEKANKPGGPYFHVVSELKAKDPDWEDVQDDSAELTRLAKALVKTTPPKGDAASWKTLTAAYVDTTTALEKAALAKNLGTARAAIARMGESCTACHKVHRKD
jgi:cytochrome c556